jgi:hypothetical protein
MSNCIRNDEEKSMKRAKTVMYLLGAGYLGLSVGMTAPELANGADSCNRNTLKGTYIWSQDGFENRRILTNSENLPPDVKTGLVPADRRPFSYAGREKYDGRGHVAGINTIAQARGATANPPTPPNELAPPVNVSGFVEYSGTYTVASNCTAVVTVADNPDPAEPDAPVFNSVYHLFLSPDGEQFTFILYSTQVIVVDNQPPQEAFELTGVGVAYRVDR